MRIGTSESRSIANSPILSTSRAVSGDFRHDNPLLPTKTVAFGHPGQTAGFDYHAPVEVVDIGRLACVTCGYDLRSLPSDGACPECGTAISRSLCGDRLAAADPAWLKTIALGQRLIAIAITIIVISIITPIVLTLTFTLLVLNRPGLPSIVESVFTFVITANVAVVPLGLVTAAVGVYLLTTQELRESDRETIWSPRNIARWSAGGAATASFAVLSFHHLPQLAVIFFLADATFLLMAVLITIACVMLLKRLSELIRRVPDEPLAMRLESERKFLRWAIPMASVYVLMLTSPTLPRTMSLLMAPFACIGFIALIGLLLTTARLTGIMRQCAAHFRLCVAVSQESAVIHE